MFKFIDREEMHVHVENEFESLDKILELEKAMKEEVVKRPLGRLKKELQAILLIPKEEKQQT